jgi:hypothetical protein
MFDRPAAALLSESLQTRQAGRLICNNGSSRDAKEGLHSEVISNMGNR